MDAPPLDRDDHRDRRLALLVLLVSFLVYNANLRLIATGDSYPARFIPFAIWTHGTVYLDPVLDATIQRHPAPYWVQPTVNGHRASLFPIVTPVLVAPLYLPAVLYLKATGWSQADLERVGILMEKLTASLVTSLAVALMYLVLRRRLAVRHALLLTAIFAFGTGSWSTSSQALWLHAVAEFMAVAALWFLTGEPTRMRAVLAGAAVGLLAANRPPDLFIALGFSVYALFWARRKTPLFAIGGLVPGLLVLAYNLISFHHPMGSWGTSIGAAFFHNPILQGIAALLVSPGRGLFVFWPFLLFVPWGVALGLRDRQSRLLTLCLLGGVLMHLWFYGRTDWRGGGSYGPRYLLDMVPLLIWLLAPVLPAFERIKRGEIFRTVFLALALFAAGVEFIGAFLYQGTSNQILFHKGLFPFEASNFWVWRNTPYLIEARNHRPASNILHALRHLGEPMPPPPPPANVPSLKPVRSSPPRAGTASDFYTVAPCRVLDTRGSPPLQIGTVRTVRIAGAACGIPEAAVAVAANFTTVGATGRGLVILSADAGRDSLELRFQEALSLSTQIILPLDPDGSITVAARGGGKAYFILDVSGYFLPVE